MKPDVRDKTPVPTFIPFLKNNDFLGFPDSPVRGAHALRPYKNAPIISCRLLRKWYYTLQKNCSFFMLDLVFLQNFNLQLDVVLKKLVLPVLLLMLSSSLFDPWKFPGVGSIRESTLQNFCGFMYIGFVIIPGM
jgi:hypothetical protein